MDLAINIGEFAFSDLLSLVLAIFAIGISVLFYIKASESSSQFYNNTYQFTKSISEDIGRMDERFGEKLSNIDKNYDRFWENGLLGNHLQNEKLTEIRKQKSETEENLEALLKEKDSIIKKLSENSNLPSKDTNDLLKKLENKEQELESLRLSIFKLNEKNEINHSEQYKISKDMLYMFIDNIPNNSHEIFKRYVITKRQNLLSEYVSKFMRPYDSSYLKRTNVLNQDNTFSSAGLELLQQILTNNKR